MGSSGLAKLSCTPTQHTGMLAGSSSIGGVVILGGAGGLLERRQSSDVRRDYTKGMNNAYKKCNHAV